MKSGSPSSAERPPHPLAVALMERLRERKGARVLEIGTGSGRNTRALSAAGFIVESYDDRPQPGYAAGLSTHALLHGTPDTVAQRLQRIAALLEPGAPLYATFGSVRDARYGEGERIAEHVYAPSEGDEIGVAHVFFDRSRLQALLEPQWIIESLDEAGVDAIAGGWAHPQTPLRGAVHWFAIARRRD